MRRFRQLRCSFCRKNSDEVQKLVAGPHVYICDECVAIASRIMNEPHEDHQPPGVQLSVWRRLLARAGKLLRGGEAKRGGALSVSG